MQKMTLQFASVIETLNKIVLCRFALASLEFPGDIG